MPVDVDQTFQDQSLESESIVRASHEVGGFLTEM